MRSNRFQMQDDDELPESTCSDVETGWSLACIGEHLYATDLHIATLAAFEFQFERMFHLEKP